MTQDRFIKQNFTGINFSASDAFGKIIENQKEINQAIQKSFQKQLKEKDREIVKLKKRIVELEGKND